MKFGKFKWSDSAKITKALESFRKATPDERWKVKFAPDGTPVVLRDTVETKE